MGRWLIVSSQNTIFFAKNMTRNKLDIGKGYFVTLLFLIINPYEQIRDNDPNMDMEQRLKNAVVLHCEMKKIRKKEAGCILFTHLDFRGGGALIELYALERWCKIVTEYDRHILFSDVPLEERM